jgi:hypothetical protein
MFHLLHMAGSLPGRYCAFGSGKNCQAHPVQLLQDWING